MSLRFSWRQRCGLHPEKLSSDVRGRVGSDLLPAEQGTGEHRGNCAFGSYMCRTLLSKSFLWQVWVSPTELPRRKPAGPTQAGPFQGWWLFLIMSNRLSFLFSFLKTNAENQLGTAHKKLQLLNPPPDNNIQYVPAFLLPWSPQERISWCCRCSHPAGWWEQWIIRFLAQAH